MKTVEDIYEGALLSEFAYANLVHSDEENSFAHNKNALIEKKFTHARSDYVLQKYSILYHYPNDKTGLSFTLFQNKDTQKYTIAIRGTDNLADMISNSGIVIGAPLAEQQTLSLANQLEILFSPKGSMVRSFKPKGNKVVKKITSLFALRRKKFAKGKGINLLSCGANSKIGYFIKKTDSQYQGLLCDKEFSIVGHSLGGHLAVAAQQLLGKSDANVYTYNAPGINVEHALLNELRLGRSPISCDNIVNIHGVGTSIIAGIRGWYGKACEVYTEQVTHAATSLSQSLRLLSLFEKLEKRLNVSGNAEEFEGKLDKYNQIINSSHHDGKEGFKRVINILNELLGGKESDCFDEKAIRIENAISSMDKNAKVTAVADEIETWDVQSVTSSPDKMYAILKCSPFLLSGIDYSAHLPDNYQEIYDSYFIEARIAYVKAYLNASSENSEISEESRWGKVKDNLTNTQIIKLPKTAEDKKCRNLVFMDDENSEYKVEALDNLRSNRIFGGTGNNIIVGGMGDDFIHGGAGDDILEGGGGNDTIIGGPGNDTYLFDFGGGHNTIIDIKGNDTIELASGVSAKDVLYRREDSNVVVELSDGASCTIVNGAKKYSEEGIETIRFTNGIDKDINLKEWVNNLPEENICKCENDVHSIINGQTRISTKEAPFIDFVSRLLKSKTK